jgi:hypothetical protein
VGFVAMLFVSTQSSFSTMKKLLLSLLVGLSLTAPACLAQTANDAYVVAVKKIIVGETDAFFVKNQEQ